MRRYLFLIMSLFSLNVFSQTNVQLNNDKFIYNGNEFFPKVLNYHGEIYTNDGIDFWNGPSHLYSTNNDVPCFSQENCSNLYLQQFQQIASWGFNAIRLCGFTAQLSNDGTLAVVSCLKLLPEGTAYYLELTPPYTNYFNMLDEVVEAAATAGIKIILLTGNKHVDEVNNQYTQFLTSLALHYYNNPTILAFDLFNEPTGEATEQRKPYIKSLSNSWYNAVKNTGSNTLVTIGENPFDVYSWDPAILNVDFLSVHIYPSYTSTYSFSKELLLPLFYWTSRYVNLPWIIGETGLSANDDLDAHGDSPRTEAQQADFGAFSFEKTCECNGSGYSWWDYHDHHLINDTDPYRFYGILDYYGNPKPVQDVLSQKFSPSVPENFNVCQKPENYYNPNGYSTYYVDGQVFGANLLPMEDVIVLAHFVQNNNYQEVGSTFTNANGQFRVYSNSPMNTIYIAAPGSYVHTLFNVNPFQSYTVLMSECNGKTNSLNITNQIICMGQTVDFEDASFVSVYNLQLCGNGTTGGTATVNASNRINVSRLNALKGSRLNLSVSPIYHDCEIPAARSIYKDKQANTIKLEELEYSIFPNPNNGKFNINVLSNDLIKVDIYNNIGQKIKTCEFNNHVEINIADQPTGIYFINLQTNNKSIFDKIIIK